MHSNLFMIHTHAYGFIAAPVHLLSTKTQYMSLFVYQFVRDWSLIMGRGGGYKTGGGGPREVLCLPKGGGGGKSFSHVEGGAQKVLG